MSTESTESDRTWDVMVDLLVKPLLVVRRSFLAFMVALGTAFVLAGALTSGQAAGILGVVGAGAILYGVVGYAGLALVGYV